MNTLSYQFPYIPTPTSFLKIINNRITFLAKSIGLLKYELEKKQEDKKNLLKKSIKLQTMQFEAKGKVQVIPRGHSSKSPPMRISTTKHDSRTKLTPEDMIASMSKADRLAMVEMLTKQGQGESL